MDANVVGLLAELVAINSVNGSMQDGPGESALAAYVADHGRALGADVSLEEVLPGRPNVTVRLPATAGAGRPRRLLFDVHLDTVPLDSMPDALVPRIEGGRMWGRGTCDTKGSLAAVLTAMGRLAGDAGDRGAEVVLLGTMDEEYRKRGIAHAVAGGLSADAAIVGEPTNLRPIIAHKGAVRWRILTRGKAAHTSRPENGNNAIYQMVEVVDYLRERIEPALALEQHPLLTPPTFTVGRIEGGVGVNIVPERCVIDIDRRTLPREDPEAIIAQVTSLAEDLMRRRPDMHVECEAPYLAERGLETAPDAGVVRALQRAITTVLGPDAPIVPEGVPYGTDATHLRGVPCVVFGPGDIAQAHSADEWVDLEQVQAASQVLYRLMRSFVDGQW